MRDQQKTIRIRIYRGERITYTDDSQGNKKIENETHTIALSDGIEYEKFLKNIASQYYCKVSIEDVYYSNTGKTDPITGIKEKGESLPLEEWKPYEVKLEAAFGRKFAKREKTMQEELEELKVLKAQLRAQLKGQSEEIETEIEIENTINNDVPTIDNNLKEIRQYIATHGWDIKGSSRESLIKQINEKLNN